MARVGAVNKSSQPIRSSEIKITTSDSLYCSSKKNLSAVSPFSSAIESEPNPKCTGGGAAEAAHHLDLWHHGPALGAGASEGGERRRGHHGAGPGEAAQVAARDVVLLVPHHDGIHDKEASPWQPERVLLGDEWGALEVQRHGDAPVGHQVEAGAGREGEEEKVGQRANRYV